MSRPSHQGPASPTTGSSEPCWCCGYRHLTAQEAAVGRLAAAGRSEREIATELFIGAVAVRTHLAHVCAKLGLRSPAALVRVGADDVLPSGGAVPRDSPVRVGDGPPALARQAVEAARLARQGRNDRAIAAELFIGIATVRAHLARMAAASDGRPAGWAADHPDPSTG